MEEFNMKYILILITLILASTTTTVHAKGTAANKCPVNKCPAGYEQIKLEFEGEDIVGTYNNQNYSTSDVTVETTFPSNDTVTISNAIFPDDSLGTLTFSSSAVISAIYSKEGKNVYDVSTTETFSGTLPGTGPWTYTIQGKNGISHISLCATSESLPVTIGYVFGSYGLVAGVFQVKWQTVTETGNAGFNIYNGDLVKLNKELIPGQIDSLDYANYEFAVNAWGVETFYIEEVGIDDITDITGPYSVNVQYGYLEVQKIFLPIVSN
jgi:hypothetical protein